ncbi:MAG TPA: LysR substrate-binding domain-containing protein [Sphingomicrobium sp.]|jgi:LysR family hydrogen peroxide-inducible transcriptional activator|nr:LysR substrate-binding domain-containing protein [Sphingomicrobium sp.]
MTAYLPTLRQLQYLVAVHDEGHFGRAAESCFVTQSTLSAGVQELEKLLGTKLVERSRQGIRFTPLGKEIVQRARRLLRDAEEIAGLAKAAGRPLSGELSMGVIPTIAPFLLPRVLPHLRKTYPELKLYLREETSQQACDALHRGGLDCVLLALPFPCGEVEAEVLFDDELLLALRENEAGNLPRPVPPAAISSSELLLLEDGHCLTEHSLAACGRRAPNSAMLGTSLHTLVQMVDNGMGLTLVPQMAVDAGILDGTSLVSRKLDADNAARRIALIWRRKSPREAEFRLLAKLLREAALSPCA